MNEFPRVKQQGRGVHHKPPSSADVKERVVLDIYSPSGPSWPVPGLILPLLQGEAIFCGHNILTDGVFVTQLSGNAGISR